MKMEGKEEKLVTKSYVHVFKVLLIGLLQFCILLFIGDCCKELRQIFSQVKRNSFMNL